MARPVVYGVSDLHGNLPEVPSDADVLLIAGDICPDFQPTFRRRQGVSDKGAARQAAWLDTEFRAWLAPLFARDCKVVATWGNHDFIGEHRFLVPDLPWHLVVDAEVTVETRGGPLRVYGTPWVPGLPYWAFYGRDEALQARAEAIPEGLDVLMSHGPPHKAGDFIPTSEKQRNKYGNFGGMNVGDPTLNDAIIRARPKAVICGHIHEARGTHFVQDTPVYNVAAVDERYTPHPRPFTRLFEV